MHKIHDVIIIGSGSAGYAAARTAHDTGADVAIVDQGPLEGSVSCVAACRQRLSCGVFSRSFHRATIIFRSLLGGPLLTRALAIPTWC